MAPESCGEAAQAFSEERLPLSECHTGVCVEGLLCVGEMGVHDHVC